MASTNKVIDTLKNEISKLTQVCKDDDKKIQELQETLFNVGLHSETLAH